MAQASHSFDREYVFSTLHQRFTFVHLFYPYLIHLTGLFPHPFNTSWSPGQHRGVVCWLCLYNASGGPSSILITTLKHHLAMPFHSEHTSSRQREFHPKPLTEPYVIVSHHTALVIQGLCASKAMLPMYKNIGKVLR
jgi:hypothetical protein